MKRCPFCAEEIQDAAILCRFCQRDLPPAPTPSTAPTWQPPALEGLAIADPVPSDVPAGASPEATERGPSKFVMVLGGIAVMVLLLVVDNAFRDRRTIRPGSVSMSAAVSTPESGPKSGLSMVNYLLLKEGMSYREAIEILGEPGVEVSRSDLAGFTTVMYQWSTTFGVGNMNAMFQNDRLVQKAQFGLR